MRVAFLSPTASLGGAERCLLDLMASLRRADGACELVLVAAEEGPLLGRAARLGARGLVVDMPRALRRLGDAAIGRDSRGPRRLLPAFARALAATPGALAHVRRLRRALEEIAPDVVHSNGMKSHVLGALARPPGVPLLWHVRDFVGARRLMSRALRLLAGRAAAAAAISRGVERDLGAAVPGLPVEVLYDGIDVTEFAPGPPETERLDALAGLPPAEGETVRVGLVATYARWKGHDLFLEAAARAHRGGAGPVRFYLVGGPIYATGGSQTSEAELRGLARSLGILDRVGFVPFQEDTAWLYRSLDVAVHASVLPEPFGRTIAEAMACARPLVAARGAGALEVLAPGDVVLFEPGDPGALAAAVSVLARDPALRQRLGAAGRRVAVERFSHDRLGGEMLAVYRRLSDRRPAGHRSGRGNRALTSR